MAEGRVRNEGNGYGLVLKMEYFITDQQGNTRVSFEDDGTGTNTAKLTQENSYYAYGMQMAGGYIPTTNPNKKLYNGGSEWQDDIEGLADYYSTFFREYDPVIGRFNGVDPIGEMTDAITSYAYANNNPVMMNDPLGAYAQGPGKGWHKGDYGWLPDIDDLSDFAESISNNDLQMAYFLWHEAKYGGRDRNFWEVGVGGSDTEGTGGGVETGPGPAFYKAYLYYKRLQAARGNNKIGSTLAKVSSNLGPQTKGTFTEWYSTRWGEFDTQVEAYRAWQSYPGYHEGEEFWDRTLRVMAYSSMEARRDFAGGGMNMYNGYGRIGKTLKTLETIQSIESGFKVEGQLVEVFSNSRFFTNWIKGNQSLSRINNPLNAAEAQQLVDVAKRLGLTIENNINGLQGIEVTGQWKGIAHFKIGNIHIPIQKGLETIIKF